MAANSRRDSKKITCIAYANDVTVLLTQPSDNKKLENIILIYWHFIGAKLNWWKSQSLPLAGRNITEYVMCTTMFRTSRY